MCSEARLDSANGRTSARRPLRGSCCGSGCHSMAAWHGLASSSSTPLLIYSEVSASFRRGEDRPAAALQWHRGLLIRSRSDCKRHAPLRSTSFRVGTFQAGLAACIDSSWQLMSFRIQAGVLMTCTIRSGWRAVSRHIRREQDGRSTQKYEAVGVMCCSSVPVLSAALC